MATLLDYRMGGTESSAELRLTDHGLVFPAWFGQQCQWVSDPVNSGSTAYNFPFALCIQGALDERALEHSLTEIVRRHEILRAVFRVADVHLLQLVVPPRPLSLPITDLRGLDKTERNARVQDLALQEASRPFDFTCGPLFRAILLRLDREEHVLLFITHHLIFDDWSIGVLIRELMTLYPALGLGNQSSFPRLGFCYADFVKWQGEREALLRSQLAFWQARLPRKMDFYHLTTDFPRPARPTYNGARECAGLSGELTDSLRAASRQERVSLFMMLLAVFQKLLHLHSGHDDIAVGCCAANRSRPETEELIGRFGNDLLLCTRVSECSSFPALLSRVRETALEAFEHQDLPFGRLMQHLRAVPDSSRDSLFQVMFVVQDAPQQKVQVPGLTVLRFPLQVTTAKYDLTAWLKVGADLEIVFEYNTDLFASATIRTMLGEYRTLLEAVAERRDRLLEVLPSEKPGRPRLLPEQNPRLILASPETGIHLVPVKPDLAQQNASDRTLMYQTSLLAIWQEVLGTRNIGITCNFFEWGGNSLQAMRMFARIEQEFARTLPVTSLFQAPTIEMQAALLAGKDFLPSKACMRTGSSQSIFFLLRPALLLWNLLQRMNTEQPLRAVSLHCTTDDRPDIPCKLESVGKYYVQAIRKIQPEGPYLLGGWCGNGVLAYEVAQQLQAEGQQIALLVLIESPNPAHRLSPSTSILARLHGRAQKFRFDSSHFGATEAVSNLVGRLKEFGQEHNPLWLAVEAYRPKPYVGKAALFRCMDRLFGSSRNIRFGWGPDLVPGLETHEISGDHYSMLRQPHVEAFSRKLCASLIDAVRY
jgi:thioesterase domain-containing protein